MHNLIFITLLIYSAFITVAYVTYTAEPVDCTISPISALSLNYGTPTIRED